MVVGREPDSLHGAIGNAIETADAARVVDISADDLNASCWAHLFTLHAGDAPVRVDCNAGRSEAGSNAQGSAYGAYGSAESASGPQGYQDYCNERHSSGGYTDTHRQADSTPGKSGIGRRNRRKDISPDIPGFNQERKRKLSDKKGREIDNKNGIADRLGLCKPEIARLAAALAANEIHAIAKRSDWANRRAIDSAEEARKEEPEKCNAGRYSHRRTQKECRGEYLHIGDATEPKRRIGIGNERKQRE